jgi:hypothetical protein
MRACACMCVRLCECVDVSACMLCTWNFWVYVHVHCASMKICSWDCAERNTGQAGQPSEEDWHHFINSISMMNVCIHLLQVCVCVCVWVKGRTLQTQHTKLASPAMVAVNVVACKAKWPRFSCLDSILKTELLFTAACIGLYLYTPVSYNHLNRVRCGYLLRPFRGSVMLIGPYRFACEGLRAKQSTRVLCEWPAVISLVRSRPVVNRKPSKREHTVMSLVHSETSKLSQVV